MIAQGITSGKIVKAMKKLILERNKKQIKRKLAEVECHKRVMEYYKGYNKRYGKLN